MTALRRIAALAASAVFALLLAPHAHGQAAARDTLTAASYERLLARFQAGDTTVATALRMSYTKTKDYSPFDSDIDDWMKDLYGQVNGQAWQAAVETVRKVLERRFVNPEAHLGASIAYGALGDTTKADFHATALRVLLRSIGEGEGLKPESPMRVIDISEEYAFIRANGLEPRGQTLGRCGEARCDVMRVADRQTGREFTLYFDVSISFEYMERTFGEGAEGGKEQRKPKAGP